MAATGCADLESFCTTAVPKVWNATASQSRWGDVVLVAFLLAQCFDGVLTYVGVLTFGIQAEANPLIGSLMLRFGEAGD